MRSVPPFLPASPPSITGTIPVPPPIGSAINILLEMQNGDVRARAVVRRVAPSKGMGIEFISMTPEDRARLNKQLQQLMRI